MNTLLARTVVVALGFAVVGCSHQGGHSGGSSFPSTHSGSSSVASSHGSSGYGSSHASGSGSAHASAPNTSYREVHTGGSGARAAGPGSSGKGAGSRGTPVDGDAASEVLQAIAAGLVNAAGDDLGGGSPAPAPRAETPCEAALREWRDMHPELGARVPPQLRCGVHGEWGGEAAARNP